MTTHREHGMTQLDQVEFIVKECGETRPCTYDDTTTCRFQFTHKEDVFSEVEWAVRWCSNCLLAEQARQLRILANSD